MTHPIEIHTIWAVVEDDSDAPWAVESWDEYSIDGNYDGWTQAIAKAKAEYVDIRVTKHRIDYSKVQAAFRPSDLGDSVDFEVVSA